MGLLQYSIKKKLKTISFTKIGSHVNLFTFLTGVNSFIPATIIISIWHGVGGYHGKFIGTWTFHVFHIVILSKKVTKAFSYRPTITRVFCTLFILFWMSLVEQMLWIWLEFAAMIMFEKYFKTRTSTLCFSWIWMEGCRGCHFLS